MHLVDYYGLQPRIFHSSKFGKLNGNQTLILTLHFVLQWTSFHLRQSHHAYGRVNGIKNHTF